MDENKKNELKILLIAIPIMMAITCVFLLVNTSSELLRYTAIVVSCVATYLVTHKTITARNSAAQRGPEASNATNGQKPMSETSDRRLQSQVLPDDLSEGYNSYSRNIQHQNLAKQALLKIIIFMSVEQKYVMSAIFITMPLIAAILFWTSNFYTGPIWVGVALVWLVGLPVQVSVSRWLQHRANRGPRDKS